ncbi:hypothetical protein Tco_0553529 [Tanacetum coccineum]
MEMEVAKDVPSGYTRTQKPLLGQKLWMPKSGKRMYQQELVPSIDIVLGLLNIQRISLTGFPAQSVGSSNTDVLDSPCLLVLITGTSQSRQHGISYIVEPCGGSLSPCLCTESNNFPVGIHLRPPDLKFLPVGFQPKFRSGDVLYYTEEVLLGENLFPVRSAYQVSEYDSFDLRVCYCFWSYGVES